MPHYFKQYTGKISIFLGLFSIIFTFSLFFNVKAYAQSVIYDHQVNGGYTAFSSAPLIPTANGVIKHVRIFLNANSNLNGKYIVMTVWCFNNSSCSGAYNGQFNSETADPSLYWSEPVAYTGAGEYNFYFQSNANEVLDYTQFSTSRSLVLSPRYCDSPPQDATDWGSCGYAWQFGNGQYDGTNTSFTNFGSIGNVSTLIDGEEPTPDNTTTRIVSFSPANGATTTSPVDFELQVYVNEDDLSSIIGVRASLHNIDQNVLALGQWFSPSDIYLFEDDIETAGLFTFSTTTPIGDGNYRLEACIERSYFSGWFSNPFSPINDCQSHQFTVGQATFIGNLTQTIYGQMDQFYQEIDYGSSTVTYLSSTCNPLGDFDIRLCATFLLIPDPQAMASTTKNIRDGILTRFPIGYVTRFVEIISNPATSTLPTFTANIMIGPAASTSLTFDIDDTLQGGADLINSITDPFHGKGFREVTEPFVQFVIYGLVIIAIIVDLSHGRGGGGRHSHRDI